MQGNEYLGTVLVLCGCCSVISLVLAAVALNISQDSDPANINIGDNYGLDPASGNIRSLPAGYWIPPWIKYDSAGRRVFSIQVGSDWPGQSYRNEEGYIVGWSVELIGHVCKEAGITCHVILDKFENCWDSEAGQHAFAGPGILSRWYDGCMGWLGDIYRNQSMKLSDEYMKQVPGHFYVKKGTEFNGNDITGKTIAIFKNWAYDDKCLARQTDIVGNVAPEVDIRQFKTDDVAGALEALKNDEVDAILASRNWDTMRQYMEGSGPRGFALEERGDVQCAIKGNTVLSRKDSDFTDFWNFGFRKLRESGKYRKLCVESAAKHGLNVNLACLE